MILLRLRQYGPFGWTELSIEGPAEEHFAEHLAEALSADSVTEILIRRDADSDWLPADEFEFEEEEEDD